MRRRQRMDYVSIGFRMTEKKEQLQEIVDRITQYAHGRRYPQPKASSESTSATARSSVVGSAPPQAPRHATPSSAPSTNIAAASPTVAAIAGESAQVSRQAQLKVLAAQIMQCTKCPLHQQRIQAVPGSGVLDPAVMVIGEAPGANEDKHGKPFIGRAGQYLDKWLESIDVYRTQNAYISNIIKCRPPENRDPLPAEIAHCKPYLEQQIELIKPKVLLIAGRIAAHHLFDIKDSLATMRTQQYTFQNIPTRVTYHPSAVLRNPNLRRLVWEDLQTLKALIAEQ